MPTAVNVPFRRISQDQFHRIDRVVRGLAFEIRNGFGRRPDEQVEQGELVWRCRKAGLEALTDVKVSVSF